MSDVDVAAIREALAKATSGPWVQHGDGWGGTTIARPTVFPNGGFGHEHNVLKTTDEWPPTDADAELIVLLRNNAEALLAGYEAWLRYQEHFRVQPQASSLRPMRIGTCECGNSPDPGVCHGCSRSTRSHCACAHPHMQHKAADPRYAADDPVTSHKNAVLAALDDQAEVPS